MSTISLICTQEPRIDMRQLMYFFQRETLGEGVADVPDTIRTRFTQFLLEHFAGLGFFVQAVNADFQAARTLSGTIPGTCGRLP